MRFDVSLYTILGPPQTSSFTCCMRPHSGPFLSFLAYYMGAPSDQFLHLLWRPPYVFFYGGPSDHFFAYYIGAPRSLSSLTIWGPSDQFLLIQYGAPLRSVSLFTIWTSPPPQISFFACYRGATSHLSFFHKIYRGPLRSVSPLTIWGPIRSVSVHTFWGPLSDHFFLLLYGAPLRSIFSLTI